MEATRKEIAADGNYRHFNLVRRRQLDGKIPPKRAPDGRLIKNKFILCPHGGMQGQGFNYLEN